MATSSEIFGGGGAKPKITVLTFGTGTYIPTADNARCRIIRVGGGAGGSSGTGGQSTGGGAGALVETMERVPIAGIAYIIGANGIGVLNTVGTDGSGTVVGSVLAPGGKASFSAPNGAYLITGDVSTGDFGALPGLSGGAGGLETFRGSAPGSSRSKTGDGNGTAPGGAGKGGGGGDSALGRGGAGTTASKGGNATGFGAGGGGSKGSGFTGGDGSPGCAEIWDYGV